jgi:O-antigen/teichoic acid export membrane protein
MLDKIRNFLFKNTSTKQTVAKNTVWLTISNFGGRLLKAIVVIYGARVLGAEGWGVFSYAVTLAGFLTLFIDPGINGILMRDASKASDEERSTIFATTFVIKICLVTLGVLIIIFIAPSFSTLPGAKALLPIVAFILAFDTMREFFSSLIRAREKMEWEAGIFLLTNVAIVAFGFIFLAIAATPASFGWAYVAGTALGAIVAMAVIRNYFKKIFSHFSSRLIAPILQAAWPFAIMGAFGFLLTNTDILIISWIRSAADVGVYSATIRIIQTLYLIPMILQFSSLPLLSRLANSDKAKFRTALERTVSLVFLASIPIALGGAILGTPLMGLIFGIPFRAGGLSFSILLFALLFDFPAVILSSAIFAYNHQKSLIVTSVIGGATNVALDILLIPHFGIAGSAVATLFAQVASNSYLWHVMKKINYFEIMPHLKKIFPAGIVMAAATYLLSLLGLHVIVNILLSGALYFAMLYLLREPLLWEIKNVISPVAVATE